MNNDAIITIVCAKVHLFGDKCNKTGAIPLEIAPYFDVGQSVLSFGPAAFPPKKG